MGTINKTIRVDAAVIFSITILSLISLVLFTNTTAAGYGYGYGYGYGMCEISSPTSLTSLVVGRYVKLKWGVVDFSCLSTSVDYYQVEIWKGPILVRNYNVSTNNTKINLSRLAGRGRYHYRVRALALTGESTDWSAYGSFRF